MVTRKEIEENYNKYKSLIYNWKALDKYDLDFTQVEVEALCVGKYEDADGRNWGYSLITKVYSKPDDRGGRYVYSVRWSFREDQDTEPLLFFETWAMYGALYLDFDDDENLSGLIFSIIPPKSEAIAATDASTGEIVISYDDAHQFFYYLAPHVIAVESVDFRGYLTRDEFIHAIEKTKSNAVLY